jgi:hypothetical protein
MNCTDPTMAASGNGVNANTIVGIVYGTLMLAIACTQLFFEYRKFRSSSGQQLQLIMIANRRRWC